MVLILKNILKYLMEHRPVKSHVKAKWHGTWIIYITICYLNWLQSVRFHGKQLIKINDLFPCRVLMYWEIYILWFMQIWWVRLVINLLHHKGVNIFFQSIIIWYMTAIYSKVHQHFPLYRNQWRIKTVAETSQIAREVS